MFDVKELEKGSSSEIKSRVGLVKIELDKLLNGSCFTIVDPENSSRMNCYYILDLKNPVVGYPGERLSNVINLDTQEKLYFGIFMKVRKYIPTEEELLNLVPFLN